MLCLKFTSDGYVKVSRNEKSGVAFVFIFLFFGFLGRVVAAPVENISSLDSLKPETKRSKALGVNLNEMGWPWQLKMAGGYALRVSPDGRTSGGAALLQADTALLGSFGLRAGVLAMGFGGSLKDPRPLAFGGGHFSFLYSVSEAGLTAQASLGPLLGWSAEFDFKNADEDLPNRNGFYAGAQLSLDVQWQISSASAFSAGLEIPIFLYDPTGFTLRAPYGADKAGLWMFQALIHVGFSFEPVLILQGVFGGEGLVELLLPHDFHLPF